MKTRKYCHTQLFAAIGLAFCLLVAGCGSQTGPSNDKVREDLFTRVNAAYHGLLNQGDFEMTEREQLSEDRIKFHVIVSYTLDPQEAQAAKNSNRVFGSMGSKLRKAKQNDGKKQELTVLYRRQSEDVWQLTRLMPGYQ